MTESTSPMRNLILNFSVNLIGLNGVPFALDDDRTLTLKDVAVEGLLMPKPNLSKDEKFGLFKLAQYIHEGNSIITEDEFSTLKRIIGEVYDQAIMGAAWLELDNQAAQHQQHYRELNITATPTP
jgi:hypothetical protein